MILSKNDMLRPEQNPFAKPPKGPLKPERELVEAYLGKEAAALLEDEPKKSKIDDGDLEYTKADRDALRKERESRIWTKRQYYDWAEEYLGKDKAWVDETFTFHPDGTTSVERDLELPGLTEPNFPKGLREIRRSLFLPSLTSAKGLKLPETIGGALHLSSLTTAEGLTLPQSIGEELFLPDLTSAEGLIFPQTIGGNLNLSGLTSARGLTLPQSIGGPLFFSRLTSAEGLKLPETIAGMVYFHSLSSDVIDKLRKARPDLRIY